VSTGNDPHIPDFGLTLDEDKLSASRFDCFSSGERASGTP